MKIKDSLPLKILLMGLMTLLLLIPLIMVRSQIDDRQRAARDSQSDVADSWGHAQQLAGPFLELTYSVEVQNGKEKTSNLETARIYPRTLFCDIDLSTQTLHRSIYDILVYGSQITLTGDFVIPAIYGEMLSNGKGMALTDQQVVLGLSDLRGVDGTVSLRLGEQDYTFHSGSKRGHLEAALIEPVRLDAALMDGQTAIPFRLTCSLRGSSSLMVKPYGETTEVRMKSNCPDPSFTGDFLPAEREVTDEGFTARWSVSEINRGAPDDTSFGVSLLQGVTQYQQAERSAKYGVLVIVLIFAAGLAVEVATKKKINLVQYLVIGLSLILFYALVLAFSEFVSFPLAYAIAAAMTVAALLGYFQGILRDRAAWVLAAAVALAYLLSYFLLQMETYAFIAGTLVLFVLLTGVMYLTRNLNKESAADQA